MILPRYSIRWLLGVTVASTAFFLIAAQARNYAWAAGVTVAVMSVLLVVFIQACVFAGIWIMTLLVGTIRGKAVPMPYTDLSARTAGGISPGTDLIDPIGARDRTDTQFLASTDASPAPDPGRPDALSGGSDP